MAFRILAGVTWYHATRLLTSLDEAFDIAGSQVYEMNANLYNLQMIGNRTVIRRTSSPFCPDT